MLPSGELLCNVALATGTFLVAIDRMDDNLVFDQPTRGVAEILFRGHEAFSNRRDPIEVRRQAYHQA